MGVRDKSRAIHRFLRWRTSKSRYRNGHSRSQQRLDARTVRTNGRGAQVTVNSPEPDVDAIRPSNLSPVAGCVRGIILDIDKKSEIDTTCSAAWKRLNQRFHKVVRYFDFWPIQHRPARVHKDSLDARNGIVARAGDRVSDAVEYLLGNEEENQRRIHGSTGFASTQISPL